MVIKTKHKQEANGIGAGSYELVNFNQLPNNASRRRQVEALLRDREWQRRHYDEVLDQIDRLIQDIEND